MNQKNLSNLTSNRYFLISLFVISLIMSFGAFIFRDFFAQSEKLGLFGILIINFFSSATFFVSGPAFLTVFAGGAIYSPLLVAFVASIGATIGDIVGFAFGYSGRHVALKRLEKHKYFLKIESIFRKYGALTLFVFAFIPNPFFDAVGLIAGVFKYSLVRFFLIVLIARFLRFMLLAFIGAKLY